MVNCAWSYICFGPDSNYRIVAGNVQLWLVAVISLFVDGTEFPTERIHGGSQLLCCANTCNIP